MRVLITGGAGFIGSHIADALISADHDVALIDNFWTHGGGRRSNVNPKAACYEIDIRDAQVADVFLRFKPEVVCHQAAQHSVAISTREPQFDADVNIKGLLNILELAARNGVRKVLFASSAATYGTPQYLPIDEKHPQAPESPYGISKMVAEYYLRYYANACNLRYTALRYGNVYGPRQDPSGEAGVIAIFCGNILRGQPVRIDWDGEQCKDYVFVGDVARANLLALNAANDQIVNIGTGIATSVNALHRSISKTIGRNVAVEYGPKRSGDVQMCVFAIDRAKKLLDWSPRTALIQGIEKTAKFFRNEFLQEAG